MGVKPGEPVLIVTDDEKLPIGQALYRAACALGAEAALAATPPAPVAGAEPPAAVAAAMRAAQVVVCPTAQSITHTAARIEAVKSGARVATMPGITEKMFREGAITADYARVRELTVRLTELLTRAERAVLEKNGRTLTLALGGRNGIPSTGIYRNAGESGNLPSGEAYIAPLEDGSDGTMEIDGSMVGIGKLDSPLTITVEKGRLREISGQGAEKLAVLFENEQNGTLCELGIGTNEKAALCGIVLEDEKVYGTVHLAFGTNLSFGGTVKAGCHLDGVILRPTLSLDGMTVLRNGEFQL